MLPFFYDFYSYSRSTREQNDVTETFIDKNYLFYLKWIKKKCLCVLEMSSKSNVQMLRACCDERFCRCRLHDWAENEIKLSEITLPKWILVVDADMMRMPA